MHKAIPGIFLSTLVIAGCSSAEEPKAPAASAPPAQTSAAGAKLRAALLPVPKGMSVAYGPETGEFGTLKSTQQGLEAVRKARAEHPECAGAAQLDAAKPEVAKSPAAVVAFSAARGSITQAVVSLPKAAFPEPLPKQCTDYTADVGGTKVTYKTKTLDMPTKGDQSRAYLTTAAGGKNNAQIGSVMIRRGTVIMSMLVVGQRVKPQGLYELANLADQNLARVTR
ncbi:unnamed protein product [[Actinomadura] parvosata subsp. kistnae]|uniref:PknH-like extracellular domain-containing protein n=1 Tax=[Actinomadura] parvosata subsp. kistnae TaxID=1909395 RepID=A0A1V0ABD9_9ACTN|nr:hypothetical protein [Nonomuraea sp. ATCC 55076]AQZ67531.1 hypothetical protein BKM31_44150 [Nonomuraea sp. ATCC 55076]SPL94197.1 unnamed protein product [Actinomadura parvosata subsp. kistnae]